MRDEASCRRMGGRGVKPCINGLTVARIALANFTPSPNFQFLEALGPALGPDLLEPVARAERYLPEDPSVAVAKLRLFAERAAKTAAAHLGLYVEEREDFSETLRNLAWRRAFDDRMADLFHALRKDGNRAIHTGRASEPEALRDLRFAHRIAEWLYRVVKDPAFRAPAFSPPVGPAGLDAALREELTEARSRIAELEAASERYGVELSRVLAAAPAPDTPEAKARAASALDLALSMEFDEAETRAIIDAQLRAAGWDADTEVLRHSRGSRPEQGRNKAIAEWPCGDGRADYVLFRSLEAVAVVEAKRASRKVSAILDQADRYARSIGEGGWRPAGGPWRDRSVPFVFATNGRPWLAQLAEESGIWFRDVRRDSNRARALEGWYSPEGLAALLKADTAEAERRLDDFGFELDFPLRYYQKDAILAAEAAVRSGHRKVLLAMATGTGKTKTCIALLYRLLASGMFRRALFLVDRNALGEQAGNAFQETRIRGLRTFAEDFGVRGIGDGPPDLDTRVSIATVQSMVRRLLGGDGDARPGVDEYDLVVVDECHRGYLLDRELSEDELEFRSYEDYVSKYRQVLDHFDAVRIGLTATPAPQTTDIFGDPVHYYPYRQAVIDGYLIDHLPPVRIETKLSKTGITWRAGEEVPVYLPDRGQIELFRTPDELSFDVSRFNRAVVTREFNRVVCGYLAPLIDPQGDRKYLVYCATDLHADIVVEELKKAFQARYGDVPDEAVRKITGASPEPLTLIRRYKNERLPTVAVTVDLLTTGIDVPEICGLVFLRRVNSRILYEQMLGRATRLCERIGKEYFEIYDAVGIYESLRSFTDMTPVVVDPSIGFEQLIREILEPGPAEVAARRTARRTALDQLRAKLHRKAARMSESDRADFEARTGSTPRAFARRLSEAGEEEAAALLAEFPGLGAWLDRSGTGPGAPLPISGHPDGLVSARHKYFLADTAEDYLERFKTYIENHRNDMAALRAVTTKPSSLTRKDLKSLLLVLDEAGFAESTVREAFRDMTNADTAASILGFIRRQALGDPLVPWERRVDDALARLRATRSFTPPQSQWLDRIARQLKTELVVDRAALDSGAFRDQGGFDRINRIFDGGLERTLEELSETIWMAQ